MPGPYNSPAEAVNAVMPGWTITGSKPATKKVPNPNRTTTSDPSEIDQQYGTELTIQSPDGTQRDTMVVSSLNAADFTDPSKQSGGAITVLQGPTKNTPTTGTKKPSDPSKWQAVYRPGTTEIVGTWDPVNNEFHAVAAPPQAQPKGPPYDPVMVTDTAADGTQTQRQVGFVDTGDKSFHPLAAPPSATPSGHYDNVYVTNADGTKRLVGMTDTGDKHFIPVSADPTTNKRTIQTPTAVYSVDDNDNVKKLIDIDKNVPLQAVVIDGTVYSFDPNEKDPTKRLVQVSANNLPQTIKQGDTTWVLQKNDDGTFTYKLPPGITQPGNLQTNTTARTLDWYDAQGNLIKSVPNKNYQAPQVNLPTVNAVSPFIPVPDPNSPNGWRWEKNEARVTASAALQSLASQLSGHVVSGDISVEEAKAIIDGANTAMQTATTAATQTLSAINQGAQAGANLLAERSRAGQQLVTEGLGILGRGQKGLLVAPPADFAQNLVQGAAGFATQLGGGPDVFQAAANLVRRADPTGSMGQDAGAAFSALTQMFQAYRQTHGGQPAPEETQALKGGGTGAGTGQQPGQTAFPSVPQQTPAEASGMVAPSGAVAGQNYGYATAFPGGGAGGYANVSNPLGFTAPTPFAQSGLPEGRSVAVPGAQPVPIAASPTFAAPMMPGASGLAPVVPQQR